MVKKDPLTKLEGKMIYRFQKLEKKIDESLKTQKKHMILGLMFACFSIAVGYLTLTVTLMVVSNKTDSMNVLEIFALCIGVFFIVLAGCLYWKGIKEL